MAPSGRQTRTLAIKGAVPDLSDLKDMMGEMRGAMGTMRSAMGRMERAMGMEEDTAEPEEEKAPESASEPEGGKQFSDEELNVRRELLRQELHRELARTS